MRLEFSSGGHKLAAILDVPRDREPTAYALFAPCFTCNKNIKTAAYLGRALADRGIATLRIDFRGLGESEGEFADASLSTNVADLHAAAAFLTENYRAPGLLIGHSFGGPAVIRAAAGIPSTRAVVTINSPADPRHITTHFTQSLPEIQERGQAMVDIVGRPYPISANFLKDLEAQRETQPISELGKPLLICHSPTDDVVPLEEAGRIFQAARHPKSFLALDGADHFLAARPDAEYVAGVIAAWSARYLAISDAK